MGLGRHRNRQSCSESTPSARPFKSVVVTLEVLYLALSAIPLLRGVPVGVVYAVNITFKSEVYPPQTRTGEQMVQSQSNSDNTRPVQYLQVVFPVSCSTLTIIGSQYVASFPGSYPAFCRILYKNGERAWKISSGLTVVCCGLPRTPCCHAERHPALRPSTSLQHN